MKIIAGFSQLNALDNVGGGKKRGTAPPSKAAAQRAGDISELRELSVSERVKIVPTSGADASEYKTDDLSRVRTALSGYKASHVVLNRMLKLAAEVSKPAANLDMPAAKNEFVSLKAELDGIALSAAYHDKQESGFGEELEFEFKPSDAEALGVGSLGVSESAEAAQAVAGVENAIRGISAKIRYLEEMQGRIEDRLLRTSDDRSDTTVKVSSMTSAKQFSMKVNVMVLKYRRHAMMAQANAAPQRVLSLIGK